MITCVGPIFLDRVIKIEEFPEKPIKLVANGLEKRLGGPAPVASFAIKSLGGEAEFIGRFGDDDAADYLKSELLNSGISIQKSIDVVDAQTSQSHIFEDRKGERMLAVFNEEKLTNDKSLPAFEFSENHSYLVDTNWIEAAHQVAVESYKYKVNCVVDLDNFTNSNLLDDVVNFASHPIFSETGLNRFTDNMPIIDALKSLYQKNQKFYAVTLGAKGVYWIENGDIFHCQSPKINVKETNGAGDVFHGAFAQFIRTKTSKEAIELATATASLKCTKSGGIKTLPDYPEVKEFLNLIEPSKQI
jgi:sulfofructose kinase